jgi:hypothetical protein
VVDRILKQGNQDLESIRSTEMSFAPNSPALGVMGLVHAVPGTKLVAPRRKTERRKPLGARTPNGWKKTKSRRGRKERNLRQGDGGTVPPQLLWEDRSVIKVSTGSSLSGGRCQDFSQCSKKWT